MRNNIRGIVVTKDGKRYLTRWRSTALAAIKAAERLAEKRNLDVKSINGMVRSDRSEEQRA